MICRHCQRDMRLISRRLCQTCYQCPSIRIKYPVKKRIKVKREKFTTKGGGLEPGRVPAEPTDALPGSPEKMKVMQDRIARNELPCHPKDRRFSLL